MMSNNWGMMGSMSNKRGTMMSNNWGMRSSMGNNWGMSNMMRSSMDSMFDWCRGIWDSLTLISHISNKSIFMVGMVGDNLDTTVGKLNSVLSLDNSIFILSLSLGKVSSILISTTILIGEWFWRSLLLNIWSWCWVIGCWGWCISNICWGSKC